jgi:glucose-1-phosphate adenylyltransferase
MKNVLAIILGGGQGSRLYPLTKTRAKPAVPVAGKYRLIDIPVSNCINSGIEKIYILTQFNSASLNRHVNQAYRPASYSDGFVEILAAQQTPDSPEWFQGTADAVRRYAWLLESWDVSEYLILSGDHLYNMDYEKFVEHHRATGADITLSVLPVDQKKASSFGLLKTDSNGKVIKFFEKPKGEALEEMRVDTTKLGLDAASAIANPFIASMGIYVFSKQAMLKLLNENPEHTDFGKEIIPNAIQTLNVQAYLYNGYWEDIGTIESFYQANLALTRHPETGFNFYETKKPIYTRARYLPPSKVHDCKVQNSIIGEGCILSQVNITNSVVGIRMQIDVNCTIEDTLLMGCDFYQPQEERQADLESNKVPMGIGENTIIRHAIIDKNAHIGKNVQIINKDRIQDICNGIVVVVKNAVIPDNTII